MGLLSEIDAFWGCVSVIWFLQEETIKITTIIRKGGGDTENNSKRQKTCHILSWKRAPVERRRYFLQQQCFGDSQIPIHNLVATSYANKHTNTKTTGALIKICTFLIRPEMCAHALMRMCNRRFCVCVLFKICVALGKSRSVRRATSCAYRPSCPRDIPSTQPPQKNNFWKSLIRCSPGWQSTSTIIITRE